MRHPRLRVDKGLVSVGPTRSVGVDPNRNSILTLLAIGHVVKPSPRIIKLHHLPAIDQISGILWDDHLPSIGILSFIDNCVPTANITEVLGQDIVKNRFKDFLGRGVRISTKVHINIASRVFFSRIIGLLSLIPIGLHGGLQTVNPDHLLVDRCIFGLVVIKISRTNGDFRRDGRIRGQGRQSVQTIGNKAVRFKHIVIFLLGLASRVGLGDVAQV